MSALRERLEQSLSSRRSREMLRSLDPFPPFPPTTPQPLVDFSSNDYLSFSTNPTLRSKLLECLNDPSPSNPSPYGPPSSRLLDGNTPSHLSLESKLSNFFESPKGGSLLFNSGFDANVGIWSCLPGPEDYILYDELVHASIHDGMRQSRVPLSRRLKILHNSIRDFDEQLTRLINSDSSIVQGSKSVWIGLESLYSMDGDLALLKEFVESVERYLPLGNGHFIVDEAHSTGLYGSKGRGLVHSMGLNHKITVRVHTFGKSLACSGAVVLCQNSLIRQYLINYSRPLIYSTVLPHMNVKAIEKSIEMLEQGFQNEPCFKIHSLANLLITRLQTDLLSSSSSSSCDISLPPHLRNYSSSSVTSTTTSTTTSSIVPILTNQPRQLSNFLINRKGYLVRPITYPTVPKGSERVRICLHANNTRDQVLGLVEAIREWQQEQEQEPEQEPEQEQEKEKDKDKDKKKRINATTPFRARL